MNLVAHGYEREDLARDSVMPSYRFVHRADNVPSGHRCLHRETQVSNGTKHPYGPFNLDRFRYGQTVSLFGCEAVQHKPSAFIRASFETDLPHLEESFTLLIGIFRCRFKCVGISRGIRTLAKGCQPQLSLDRKNHRWVSIPPFRVASSELNELWRYFRLYVDPE